MPQRKGVKGESCAEMNMARSFEKMRHRMEDFYGTVMKQEFDVKDRFFQKSMV